MSQNSIKNLGAGVFFTAIFVYALLLNYSLIGLAITVVAVGLTFLTALVYKKNKLIVEKVDVYILITFVDILALHYDQLRCYFTLQIFSGIFRNPESIQIMSLIVGAVLGMVFNSISKSKKSLAARIVNKFISRFLIVSGLAIFIWSYFDISVMGLLLFVFTIGGMVAFCIANESPEPDAIVRPGRITLLIALLLVVLPVLCPGFSLTSYNNQAFLSAVVFPWYSVLVLSLILLSVMGIGIYFGKDTIDKDTLFVSGLVGLIWVVKSAVYFYFSFSWIAVCVYAVLFIGFINRFVKRNGTDWQSYVKFSLNENEFYWNLIASVSLVVSIYLIHIGYVFFWISLLLGTAVVLFMNKGAVGWGRDALLWISLMFCIAVSACMLSVQNGFNQKKIVIIAAMFVFASACMWMLNHKNKIGRNRFTAAKAVMAAIFALLVIIPALKAGSHMKLKLNSESDIMGSLLFCDTSLNIEVEADGKNNEVTAIRYVWSDSFLYKKEDVVSAKVGAIDTEVENSHLIIWAEDSFGVVSRRDFWFYDASRADQ